MKSRCLIRSHAARWGRAALVGVTLLAAVGGATSFAQPPESSETMSGKIRSFTTAPRGEQDGAILDDGAVVHWPPHLGERITAMIKPGDRVRVAGRMETGPAGDRHFEVSRITNASTGDSMEVAIGPPPPRGPREPRRGRPQRTGEQSARGVVREFTRAPRGEVDGLVLDNGAVVHWPPHLEEEFKPIAKVGDRVLAFGQMETTPRGDTHLETTGLKNLDTGDSRGDVDSTRTERGRGPNDEPSDARWRALEERIERLERLVQELNRQR